MRKLSILSSSLLFTFFSFVRAADCPVGRAAPDFSGIDSNGKTHELSNYKGKYVVLEWLNYSCPFVKKEYDSKNMQSLQKEYTAKGVVWLSVISSAPGKEGYGTPQEINQKNKEAGNLATGVILDPEGKIGRLYNAKTSPHMFIINPEGVLIYNGAIDDKPTRDQKDIATAKNYVKQALDEAMNGKPVSISSSQPYGCSVKYTK